MKKVVVIGGGIAGMGAALTLQEKVEQGEKIDYLLLEADNSLGGKIITEEVDGFVVEGGPDCFLSEKPWVGQMAEKLNIEDRLMGSNEASKATFVYSKGKLHSLPDGMMLMMPTKILPFAFSSLISWPGKLRMGMDLILPKKKDDADENLGEFVKRRMGQEALDKIAEPLIGGIHAGDPDHMSIKACFPRFLQMEQKYGSLIKAMLTAKKMGANRPKKKEPGKVEKTFFMTFQKGMSELVDYMAERIPEEYIKLGKKVTEITEETDSKGQKSYTIKVEGMDPVKADAVIMATPAHVAAKLTEKVDEKIAHKLGEIPFASSATVSLAFKKADINRSLKAFGCVIPSMEKRKIMAVTFSSTKWNNRTPDDEHVLVRAFVGGAKNQELVALGDVEMDQLVRKELQEIFGIDAEPIFTKIFRWEKGMPQYTMGHLDRLEEIDKKVAEHPGLYLVGGSYRGVGIGDCMNAGSLAADKAVELVKAKS